MEVLIYSYMFNIFLPEQWNHAKQWNKKYLKSIPAQGTEP